MNKRILSIILVLTMLVGMLAVMPISIGASEPAVWDGSVADDFAGGDGTAEKPYLIANGAQLALMSKKINEQVGLNAYYMLTADIYLNAGDAEDFEANGARQLTSMGAWSDVTNEIQKSFGGSFDGDGHVISGLYQNGEGNQGLFGNISRGAEFKNFALVNSYVKTSGAETGAIVGQVDRNLFNGKTVDDGIVFSNIYTDAIVVGTGDKIAGIFGNISGASGDWTCPDVTMTSVIFAGSVKGKNHCAGLIGYSAASNLTLTDCMNVGTITTTANNYAAGLVGRHEAAEIDMTRCISAGTIAAKGVGSTKVQCAIFAASNKKSGTSLTDCLYVSNVLSCSTYLYYNVTTSSDDTGASAIDYNDLYDAVPEGWSNWTGRAYDVIRPVGIASNMAIDENLPFANGSGTEADPFIIANADDLAQLAEKSQTDSFEGMYFELTASIALTGENNHTPIGNWGYGFGGHFDGNGYVISGLNITSGADGSIALFGCIQGGAVIENLSVVDAYIEATASGAAAAVVGQVNRGNEGEITISNVYADATIVANGTEVGGILGNVSDSNSSYEPGTVYIDSVVFNGSVSAKGYCGGIVGNARNACVEITNSMNLGTVTSTGNYAAGMVTSSKAGDFYIENCVSAGNIVASSYACAIASYNPADTEDDMREVIASVYVGSIASDGATRHATLAEVTAVETIAELIGANAKAPETFVKRDGDIAVPENCTVAPANVFGQQTVNGAAVRLTENSSGLRFTAVIGADYLNALVGNSTDYSYGIIIAPTDYVEEAGGFTVEALETLSYTVKYKEIKADKLVNEPEADGYYMFTGALAPIQEANYGRAFSAISYVKVDGVYYYANYDKTFNSRDVATVASNALADTSATMDEVYKYEIVNDTETVYSPYTEAERKILADFFQ